MTLELTTYGRDAHKMTFRTPNDIAEMVAHCNASSHIWFHATDGTAKRAKVNGKVRTWKRDLTRVEVPLKYGLYEYGLFTSSDIDRVLIPVDGSYHA